MVLVNMILTLLCPLLQMEDNNVDAVLSREFQPPNFKYFVADTNHYSLVLDLNGLDQETWEKVRKSLFRFLQTLPNGSILSLVSQVNI